MSIPKTRSKMHVKTGDTVVVISGTEKGKQGKVMAVNPRSRRVIVERVNMITRHTKARSQSDVGGRIEKEGSIHASNVMLYCGKCKKGVRTGKRMDGDKKVRVCKSCGGNLDD
ncbi:MAG: 50S ribosomal protein L24 [Christensenellales bacterium]|jgi:large subunit ribosomal protein L24